MRSSWWRLWKKQKRLRRRAGDPHCVPLTLRYWHRFGKESMARLLPPSPRSVGIRGLAGFCDLILGLQRVRGKILSPNELVMRRHSFVRDVASIGHFEFLGKGWMNMGRVWK